MVSRAQSLRTDRSVASSRAGDILNSAALQVPYTMRHTFTSGTKTALNIEPFGNSSRLMRCGAMDELTTKEIET